MTDMLDSQSPNRTFRIACRFAGAILLIQGAWVATPLYWQITLGEGGLGPWSEDQLTYLWRVICGGWIGLCGWAYLSQWVEKREVMILLGLFHLYLLIGVLAYLVGGGDDRQFCLVLGSPHALLILIPIVRFWNN